MQVKYKYEINKQRIINENNIEINEEEFKECFKYIIGAYTDKSLTLIGLSKKRLRMYLIFFSLVLLLILSFLLLGIKAFATGGVFNTIINSAIPAGNNHFFILIFLASGKSANAKCKKKFDIKNILKAKNVEKNI